jgi:DNA-binding transcriptional LysR family regulator
MKSDLDSIAVFVAVVNSGSLSAAARELGLTPSAISKRMASLENRVGVVLLRRTTRKFVLTEAGQEFFESTSQSLAALSEAEENLARFRSSPHGLLRIKAPQTFGRLHIAPAISEFMTQNPEVRIDLTLGNPRRDFIEEGIDIYIASSDPQDANIVARTLTPIERVTCASPSYLERFGRPQSFSDLSGHNCLIFAGSESREDEWVLYEESGPKRAKVTGTFRTNDAESLYLAAIAGVGLAHMPTFVVGPALASGKLIAVFHDKHSPSGARMKAYFPRARHRLPKVRAFVDYLVAHFAKQAGLADLPRKVRHRAS